jgi:hypothetical protein
MQTLIKYELYGKEKMTVVDVVNRREIEAAFIAQVIEEDKIEWSREHSIYRYPQDREEMVRRNSEIIWYLPQNGKETW